MFPYGALEPLSPPALQPSIEGYLGLYRRQNDVSALGRMMEMLGLPRIDSSGGSNVSDLRMSPSLTLKNQAFSE
jgi:hypothetical protein